MSVIEINISDFKNVQKWSRLLCLKTQNLKCQDLEFWSTYGMSFKGQTFSKAKYGVPKIERRDNFQYIKLFQSSIFERIEDTIICF